MYYLFFEVWVLLLLAFILGGLAYWLFSRRVNARPDADTSGEPVATSERAAAAAVIPESWKPSALAEQPREPDDLQRIKGIGAVIEAELHEIGVYQYQQIAAWNDDNIAWVESLIAFPGRITRENWPGQAAALDGGGST